MEGGIRGGVYHMSIATRDNLFTSEIKGCLEKITLFKLSMKMYKIH